MIRSRMLTFVIAAVMAFSVGITPASAVTSGDLQRAKQKAEDARKKAASAEQEADRLLAETKRLDGVIDGLQKEVNTLQGKIDVASARRSRLESEIGGLRRDIAVKESEIAKTQQEFETQQGLLEDRMRDTYKQGLFFYFELLLDAENVSDLIARTSLVQRVIGENQRIAIDLRELKLDLDTARDGLERDLQAVEVKRSAVAAEERNLKGLRDEQAVRLTTQRDAAREKSELAAEERKNAARYRAQALAEDRESKRIEQELANAGTGGSGVYNGVMAWPVPSSQRLTSPFGWRTHPIFGTRRFHSGIDIGAPSGATIVAAGDGTVISASYRNGYGNTIVLDHGDGLTTLYAHQSGFAVSSGQRVTKGQKIGYVGSTGWSTGPHLHFEVRVNGVAKDPMSYVR